jgi:hypothetical protein
VKEYTIAYDCKLKRPGCVLIQAAMATIPSGLIHQYFDADSWLVAPTPDMHVYPITLEQLPALAAKTQQKP